MSRRNGSGRWANGFTRLYLGDFVAARALLERCLADPAYRGGEVTSVPTILLMLPASLAWTLAYPGLHRSSTVAAERVCGRLWPRNGSRLVPAAATAFDAAKLKRGSQGDCGDAGAQGDCAFAVSALSVL